MLRCKKNYFCASKISFTFILVHVSFGACFNLVHIVLALILTHFVLVLDFCSDIYKCVFEYILHVLDVNVYLDICLHVLDEFSGRICIFDECTSRMCKLFGCIVIFILI